MLITSLLKCSCPANKSCNLIAFCCMCVCMYAYSRIHNRCCFYDIYNTITEIYFLCKNSLRTPLTNLVGKACIELKNGNSRSCSHVLHKPCGHFEREQRETVPKCAQGAWFCSFNLFFSFSAFSLPWSFFFSFLVGFFVHLYESGYVSSGNCGHDQNPVNILNWQN